jgi:uncharacterized protein HemX
MSRNRMRNSQSLHWMGVVKWILIATLLAGLGLCYMICKNQNLHLAQKTQEVRKQLAAIESRNEQLSGDLQTMKSMKLLASRLKMMHSSLVAWGDPHAEWINLEQNTRARLVAKGTMPNSPIGVDSVPVASTGAASQLGH